MTLQGNANAAQVPPPGALVTALSGSYPSGIIPLQALPPDPHLPEPSGGLVVDIPTSRVTWNGPGSVNLGISITASLRAGGAVPLTGSVGFALNGAPFIGSGLPFDFPVAPAQAFFAYKAQFILAPGEYIQLYADQVTNADPIETIGAILSLGAP
jgi:hypothetical protein